MKLAIHRDRWKLKAPFSTSQETITHIETLRVELDDGTHRGRGEALGVDYRGETAASLAAQVETLRPALEAGLDHDALQDLLPAGGARNALDCALWDLRAKREGRRVWEMLQLPADPVTTVYTLSLGPVADMLRQARQHAHMPVLKLKLDRHDTADKIRAVRSVRPDASIIIDANGGWSPQLLDALADTLLACRIDMVEQPLMAGQDAALARLDYPVTLCADESCQHSGDLAQLAQRYRMVNIKLDKSGGLSEALRMAAWCQENGMELMVGNMLGSSLAMAPAFVIAQFCRFVDLDGPLWQCDDFQPSLRMDLGQVQPPEARLWG